MHTSYMAALKYYYFLLNSYLSILLYCMRVLKITGICYLCTLCMLLDCFIRAYWDGNCFIRVYVNLYRCLFHPYLEPQEERV